MTHDTAAKLQDFIRDNIPDGMAYALVLFTPAADGHQKLQVITNVSSDELAPLMHEGFKP